MQVQTAELRTAQPAGWGSVRSPVALARFAGALYLIITVFAGIAHFYVPAQLLVPGDPAATAQAIRGAEATFRLALGSELVILLAEVVLTVVLFVLFRPVNATLALIAAVFRLIMTTIHGVNLINYLAVLTLLHDPNLQASFAPAQIDALVQFFLTAHRFGFTIGIVFLFPHVLLLGYLVIRSRFLPKFLGVLLLVAGCGYLVDTTALLLFASYTTTPAFVALPIAVAEVTFPLWLLVGGVRRAALSEVEQ